MLPRFCEDGAVLTQRPAEPGVPRAPRAGRPGSNTWPCQVISSSQHPTRETSEVRVSILKMGKRRPGLINKKLSRVSLVVEMGKEGSLPKMTELRGTLTCCI